VDARLIVKVLLLLSVANGTPVVVKHVFGSIGDRPLDGGFKLADGNFLFGPSKTIRGILSSLIATTIVGLAIDFPLIVGLIASIGAMSGDLASSFLKRRLGLVASSRATGIDQLPESLVPCLLLRVVGLPISAINIVIIVALFFGGEILISRALFTIGMRDRPY
jgi:CDP-2,3-bis-(O-geranylgeranyl)-sn-glycerol synthase